MNIILITIPIFAIIALGYGARLWGLVPRSTALSLSNYVYYFALPAYIILEVGSRPLRDLWELNTILAYSGGMIALALLMVLMGRVLKWERRFLGMMTLNVIFGSVAYVGVPFNQLAFGTQVAPTVSLLIALTIALSVFWSLIIGIAEIEGGKGVLRRIFLNPLIISIIVAVFFSSLSFEFPEVVKNILSLLALTAGPVALFAEGAFLQGRNFWADWRPALLLSLLKLIALPGLTLLFLWFLPSSSLNASIALTQAAMPIAVTNFIFAQQFKIAPRLVASSTLLSVALSFFTLTALLYILPLLPV